MKAFGINISALFLCLFLYFSAASAQSESYSSLNPDIDSGQDAFEVTQTAQKLGYEWKRESYERAFELYLEASEKWKMLNKNVESASCLREAARLSVFLGDKQKAVNLLKKALSALNQNASVDEKIKILSQLSLISFELGNEKESEGFFTKALSLAQTTETPQARAAAHFSAGSFYYYRENLDKAADHLRQAVELWKKAGDLRELAKTYIELGYVFSQKSDYTTALTLFNLALERYSETNDSRGQTIALKAIGTAHNLMNEKQKALESYQKAVNLFPDDIDYSEKAVLYNGIGSIYEYYGDWMLAAGSRRKALELFQKDNFIYGQLATLYSLGKSSHLGGDDDLAVNYFKEAESLTRKQNDDFYPALIQEGLGSIRLKRGDYKEASENFKNALNLLQKQHQERHAARIMAKLGQTSLHQNQFALARKYFLDSLELNKKVRDKFAEADTLFNLAMLDRLENRNESGLRLAKNSIEITESLYSEVLNTKLKSAYLSGVFERYELYIRLLMKMDRKAPNQNYAIQALQAAEKSRSRSMLETLSLAEINFAKDADPEIIKQEKETRNLLNTKADKLTDLLSKNTENAEIEKLDREIRELENRLEEIKAQLKQQSPLFSALKNPAPFDLGGFQKNILDENSLLLEFSFGESESYLWLVSKNEVASYILPPRREIENSIDSLLEQLAKRERKQDESIEDYQKRVIEAENKFKIEAKQLSKQLFGQASEKLSKKRLIIVPDGKLHYFPISALPFPNSESEEPILLTNEMIYEPSAQTLSLLSKNGNQEGRAEKTLLIFSDPVFNNSDWRLSDEFKSSVDVNQNNDSTDKFRYVESLNTLQRLEASKTEAEQIIKIVGGSNSTSFSGFAANRENLLKVNAADYKIIHFATHALVNEKRPELSGIILSRFDENGAKLDETFRINDIYSLNLNADLIVLSACNTGLGKEVKGEGLQSLNNAFLQVGAKSVIASLWKVEDNAAHELMKNFYEELATESVAPSEALRRAKIKLRQNPQYRSPFYWAAFTVQGDFRNIPKLTGNYQTKLYLLGIIPLLMLGIYLLRKKEKGLTAQ